jgi:hypothetical protein
MPPLQRLLTLCALLISSGIPHDPRAASEGPIPTAILLRSQSFGILALRSLESPMTRANCPRIKPLRLAAKSRRLRLSEVSLTPKW